MEQRPSYRLPVEVGVWVYQNDAIFQKSNIQNVSKDGLFITIDVMLIPINSLLEIKLDVQDDPSLAKISITVRVIHRSLDGVGVKIEHVSQNSNMSIQDILAQISTKSYLLEVADLAA